MRTALAVLLLYAVTTPDRGLAMRVTERALDHGVRLAGISDTVPGLFLKIVNDKLKGRIEPRLIRYEAPSSVVLEDAVLLDPHGDPVARATRAQATLSLSSLLLGEIVISRIDLSEPKLLLALHRHDGEISLNLLEALTPKKKPEKKPDDEPSGAFRIDQIVARDGGFRFIDGENITITADDVDATASVDVDLERESVLVDVRNGRVKSGAVKLPQLDVPISGLTAESVRVLTNRLDVRGVSARVAGAHVTAWGSLGMKPPGDLGFTGTIDAPANAWPERLKRLPFDTPPIKATVKVTGEYQDPLVHVEADTQKPAELYGYIVESAHGVVDVTKDRVRILDGSTARAGGGIAKVDGAIAIPNLDGALNFKATDVPLTTALRPAKIDPAPKGTVSGKGTIKGVFDGNSTLDIDAVATGRRVEMYSVKAQGEVTADAHVKVLGQRVTLERVDVRAPGVIGNVSGVVDNESKKLDLDVGVTAENPVPWVPSIPSELVVDGATFDGTVKGTYDNVRVAGAGTAKKGVAWGTPFAEVRADVSVVGGLVTVSGAKANAANGKLALVEPFTIETKEPRPMKGKVTVAGAELAQVRQPDGKDLPLKGTVNGEIVIGGTAKQPLVDIRAAAGGVEVSGEKLGAVTARGRITRDQMKLDLVEVQSALVQARSDSVSLRFADLRLDASARVSRVDLSAIEAARKANLAGYADGVVTIAGDARAPAIHAKLDARGIKANGTPLGDGPVIVGLLPDGTITKDTPGKDVKHTATVAASLASSRGLYDVTLAYAIQRKIIHAKARLEQVDLAPFTGPLADSAKGNVARFEGFVTGIVEVEGPLEKLTGRANIVIPELALPRHPDESTVKLDDSARELPPLRTLGEVALDLHMERGELAGRVCAFPGGDIDAEAPCTRGERVWATVQGELDAANGAFDLGVDALIEERAIEDVIPALATRGFAASAKARVAAQIAKRPAGKDGKSAPVDITADASLLTSTIVSAGAPPASLVEPAQLTYVDKRVTLQSPARFATENGDVDLTLAGSAGDKDLDFKVNGTTSLSILKLFTKEIANASSTAEVALQVKGKYADGIAVDGTITPTPGAYITARSYPQPITFLGGSLAIAPTTGKLFKVTADGLRARVGEGEVQLRGDVDVRTAREADESWITRFDLTATGNAIEIRRQGTRAEGSFDLVLEGDETRPVLRGRVEVTEGSFKKDFELRNFVLAAAPGKRSEPLWQTLQPFGLGALEMDVALNLSNFRTLAKVATFSADMSLRGNLRLKQTLRLPQIQGAVEVEEGTIDFPRARFDITEMQIEFPTTADGHLSPLVHLTARAEIPPGGAGTNDTEIPIDLYLDGSLEEGMQLDLTAIDPGHEWSRSDLLGLILFGKTLENTISQGDANIAVRALVREATAPITAELETALSTNLGLNVELDATGWRWQVGRRLELEGAGLLIDAGGGSVDGSNTAQASSASGTGAATTTEGTGASPSSYSTDAVRLRFLVLDHLPVGKNLSFESRAGFGASDVRLSLRLIEW